VGKLNCEVFGSWSTTLSRLTSTMRTCLSRRLACRPVIPDIDIWRAALLMAERYGGEKVAEQYADGLPAVPPWPFK